MGPSTKEVEATRYIDSFSQGLTFNDPRASARIEAKEEDTPQAEGRPCESRDAA
jgi:hypothetical protein